MTSKAEYLKKYLSKEDGGSDKKKKKKLKVKSKKQSNLAILDDDVDWKALVPKYGGVEAEEDLDDAPVVAAIHDEEAERLHPKWQPMNTVKEDDSDSRGRGRGFRAVGSPDLSPPRQRERRHDSSDLSPPRETGKRGGSPNLSPPRKSRRRGDSPDQSPPRRSRRGEEIPDLGPTRRRGDSPDQSPPRRSRRKEQTPDLSPPRKARRRGNPPDLSPPRRDQKRFMSHDRHLSPPRIQKKSSSSPLKTLEKQRHDSPDLSPTRLRRRHDSGSDLSPPRRHDSPDSDLSPPRKSRRNSSDLSPPRKGISDRSSGWDRERDAHQLVDRKQSKGVTKMASGTTAGLQAAEVMREENAQARERQETFYKTLDPAVSGRHAETVYRDKEGQRIDPKMERARKREEKRQKDEENEQFMEWGRGIAQTKQAHERISDELYEMSKPLARYADDEDLEKMLREREREGDPMLAFFRSKKGAKTTQEGRPKKKRPAYKGSFPPNRFGVRPGYRWDGVNRSNGFEKAWFSREANKMATSEQAYKWSVEDM